MDTPSADRSLLNLFTDLTRAGHEDAARTLARLCDTYLDTTPATTGQALAVVQLLREAHPDLSNLILNLVTGRP